MMDSRIWSLLRRRLENRLSKLSPSTGIITQINTGVGMKTLLNIVSILLILAGGIFFLQGINVLPGSYMTGDPQWAINGGVMIVIALGLMLWANRRK